MKAADLTRRSPIKAGPAPGALSSWVSFGKGLTGNREPSHLFVEVVLLLEKASMLFFPECNFPRTRHKAESQILAEHL